MTDREASVRAVLGAHVGVLGAGQLGRMLGLAGRALGLDVGARRRRRHVLELRTHLRTPRRCPPRVEVGRVQRAVEVRDVVLAPHEPRPAQDLRVGLLHEILGVLARTAQRPRRAEEPVDVVAEGLRIERTSHCPVMFPR